MDAVAIGELLIDLTETARGGDGYPILEAHPGGAPANYLAALAKYGKNTAFIGKVGDDAFGALLLRTLAEAGIDTRGVVTDAESFTTLAFVTLDGAGERSFSFARKPGADTRLRPEEVDRRLIDGTRVLHFGTLSLTDEPARSAVRESVACARRQGKLLSFDPNYRAALWASERAAAEWTAWGAEAADVVKLSDEEGRLLTGAGPEETARILTERFGAGLALVTLGAEGCLLRSRKAAVRLRPPAVAARDTTGAGDIFGGAAMARLLELGREPGSLDGDALREIGAFASAAAALSTLVPGGIPSVPERSAVESAAKKCVEIY